MSAAPQSVPQVPTPPLLPLLPLLPAVPGEPPPPQATSIVAKAAVSMALSAPGNLECQSFSVPDALRCGVVVMLLSIELIAAWEKVPACHNVTGGVRLTRVCEMRAGLELCRQGEQRDAGGNAVPGEHREAVSLYIAQQPLDRRKGDQA